MLPEHRNDREISKREDPNRLEGRIKRSQRDIPVVSYEELEDDIDDLDQPKRFRYRVNCLLGQCNCMEEEGKQTPVI